MSHRALVNHYFGSENCACLHWAQAVTVRSQDLRYKLKVHATTCVGLAIHHTCDKKNDLQISNLFLYTCITVKLSIAAFSLSLSWQKDFLIEYMCFTLFLIDNASELLLLADDTKRYLRWVFRIIIDWINVEQTNKRGQNLPGRFFSVSVLPFCNRSGKENQMISAIRSVERH